MSASVTQQTTPQLSVVATVYNDAPIVPLFVKTVIEVLDAAGVTFELILVNDHSRDRSDIAIAEECRKDRRIKGITLSRNFGQHIALSAGLRFAQGQYVVTIDGDLQNPVQMIPVLLSKIKEGYDIVYTTSGFRNNIARKLTSALFWKTVSKLSRTQIIPHQLVLRIMTAEFVAHFNSYPEKARTIGGITADMGFHFTTIEVKNARRFSGRSNYSFLKRLGLCLDVMISMAALPIEGVLVGSLATAAVLGAVAAGLLTKGANSTVVVASVFFYMAALIFCSAICFTLVGLSRYLTNVYSEVRARPLFIVQRSYNLSLDSSVWDSSGAYRDQKHESIAVQ